MIVTGTVQTAVEEQWFWAWTVFVQKAVFDLLFDLKEMKALEEAENQAYIRAELDFWLKQLGQLVTMHGGNG